MHYLGDGLVHLWLVLCCVFGIGTAYGYQAGNCKAYPGSRNWPSKYDWRSLNDTLGGKLLAPPPPGGVCHSGQPTYDANQCPDLRKNWGNYTWHTTDPVSVMWDQYTNFSCLSDPSAPCSRQGYPPYVVEAHTAEHVRSGIDFAQKHNVRLIIKNTGHDFLGRSVAPGALSIWTRHLNSMKYHPKQFRLNGSGRVIRGNAMTVGAGVQMYDAYKFANDYHQTLVGANGASVGFGGYISGGGHSFIAPHFGMAADNVLQMEVVTPKGHILTVNEDRHPDLFWAFRGGGGSTFGVITKVTMSTHPKVKVTGLTWAVITDPKAPFRWDVVSYVVSQFPKLMDSGLSGAGFILDRFPNPVPTSSLPRNVSGILSKNIILNASDPKMAQRIFEPIKKTLKAKWYGKALLSLKTQEYPSFFAWYKEGYDHSTGGKNQYLVSRLLGKNVLEHGGTALKDALEAGDKPNGQWGLYSVAGKGVRNAKSRGGNAVNPAWRGAYVEAVATAEFPPFDQSAERDAIKILDESFQPLRDMTPHSGAYINEASPFEKDWQRSFWGSNYERLLAIKKQVDPHDVLWCTPCVGSEGWRQREDGRLCRA